MNSPIKWSWQDLQSQTLISSCEAGLKYNKRAVGYLSNIQATASRMGMSFWPVRYDSS